MNSSAGQVQADKGQLNEKCSIAGVLGALAALVDDELGPAFCEALLPGLRPPGVANRRQALDLRPPTTATSV
eukprot:SAG22_NODE_1883_length_3378_cov_3.332723_3_plen_72_part_00